MNQKITRYILEIGTRMDKDMGEVSNIGLMELSLKATGNLTWLMEKEGLSMPMEMFMKENG